jgi:hypothetical protein
MVRLWFRLGWLHLQLTSKSSKHETIALASLGGVTHRRGVKTRGGVGESRSSGHGGLKEGKWSRWCIEGR